MAAFTGSPAGSSQYVLQTTEPRQQVRAIDIEGELKFAHLQYTHALGAGTGEVNLGILPAGRLTLLVDRSRLVTSAFAANADIHIGYRAYTNLAGTAVVEDDNAFLDNGDAASGLDVDLVLPAAGFFDLSNRGGVTIFAMIDTGNIENDDTIDLMLVYAVYGK